MPGLCTCQKEINNSQASDGKLYVMTACGGSRHDGFIFSFEPSATTIQSRKILIVLMTPILLWAQGFFR